MQDNWLVHQATRVPLSTPMYTPWLENIVTGAYEMICPLLQQVQTFQAPVDPPLVRLLRRNIKCVRQHLPYSCVDCSNSAILHTLRTDLPPPSLLCLP